MAKEKTLDLFILFLNVMAIMLLVGILSTMVTTADADRNEAATAAPVPMVAQADE